MRPVNLNNLKLHYLDKLDRAKEEKQNIALPEIKALKYDNTFSQCYSLHWT